MREGRAHTQVAAMKVIADLAAGQAALEAELRAEESNRREVEKTFAKYFDDTISEHHDLCEDARDAATRRIDEKLLKMTTRLDEITERIPREMAEVEERIIESSEQLRRKVDDFLTLRVEVESAECKVRHQAIQARTDTHKAASEGEFKTMRADRETATDELYEEMKSSALLMSKNKNKLHVTNHPGGGVGGVARWLRVTTSTCYPLVHRACRLVQHI